MSLTSLAAILFNTKKSATYFLYVIFDTLKLLLIPLLLVPTDAVDGIVSVYAWDFCIEVLVFKI